MIDTPNAFDLREIAFDLSPRIAANGEYFLDPWDAAEYAAEEYLYKDQVVAIMQGLQPPRRRRRGRTKCLDEYWYEVQRLLDDVRHRRVPMPCRPRELVHWAKVQGIELPEMFVKYVQCPYTPRVLAPAKTKPEQQDRKPRPIVGTPAQQARIETQAIAIRIWKEKPTISIEKMLLEKAITARTGHFALDTVRKWISEVDPRPPESKPGPRRVVRTG